MFLCFFFQVENFAELGDPGEAWFGEEAAARRKSAKIDVAEETEEENKGDTRTSNPHTQKMMKRDEIRERHAWYDKR